MRRRDFFRLSAAGASSLLLAEEPTSWSPAVNGLRLCLSLESRQPQGNLHVFFYNLNATPLDLFLARGEEHKVQFTAITLDRRALKITDALSYRPCASLCGEPITERLYPGTIHQYIFPLEKQLYVPPKGRYTTLAALLGSCSMQASFEVTSQELKELAHWLEDPWLGRVATGEIRV